MEKQTESSDLNLKYSSRGVWLVKVCDGYLTGKVSQRRMTVLANAYGAATANALVKAAERAKRALAGGSGARGEAPGLGFS